MQKLRLLPIVLLIVLMLALSGCSMLRQKTALWTPAQSSMVKSEKLPELAPVDTNAKAEDKTDIGKDELTQYALKLIKMYKRLGQRHDALVDDVLEQLRKQEQQTK